MNILISLFSTQSFPFGGGRLNQTILLSLMNKLINILKREREKARKVKAVITMFMCHTLYSDNTFCIIVVYKQKPEKG